MNPVETKKRILALENEDDRRSEIVYWAMSDDGGWGELIAVPYPIVPQDILDYRQMSKREKDKVDIKFWEQPHISDYMNYNELAKNHNTATLEWLNKLMVMLPDDDMPNKSKLKQRINEIKLHIDLCERMSVFDVKNRCNKLKLIKPIGIR